MDLKANIVTFLPGSVPAIEIGYFGPQSRRTMQTTAEHVVIEAQAHSIAKVRMLIDLTHIGHFDTGAVDEALSPKIIINYEKIAIFGQKGFVAETTRIILRSAGFFYRDKLKMFEDRDSALRWLQA
jgi:hypothetical protein